MRVLSIDAWGNNEGGYEWNSWCCVGNISVEDFDGLTTDKYVADWFYRNGFTTTSDLRKVSIEDDQYNIVILERKTQRPLYAIEYNRG
jgi:hypothetical protein